MDGLPSSGYPPVEKGVWVKIGGINPNKKGVGKI
jgi:hypothetical protein